MSSLSLSDFALSIPLTTVFSQKVFYFVVGSLLTTGAEIKIDTMSKNRAITSSSYRAHQIESSQS